MEINNKKNLIERLKNKRILAFIPARGGSKSIPLKNMIKINRKPLLYYSINQIKKCKNIFDDVICSTDNLKIKQFVIKQGIEVIDRPNDISQDDSTTDSSIMHCINKMKKTKKKIPEIIVLFQPTSPFVIQDHIFGVLEKMIDNPNTDSVQTICKVDHHNHAYNQREIIKDNVNFIFKKKRLKYYNKQKKPDFYKLGNLICFKTKSFLKKNNIFGDNSLGYIIPEKYSMDIDSMEDVKQSNIYIKEGWVKLD